ncbi:MAG: MerR family transcriptional regulator [Bacilli bacterium]
MLTIKEVSDQTEVTQSTIRYYEKEGVLPSFDRDANNVRSFTERDVELIQLVKCLRTIGMPMKEIRKQIHDLIDDESNVTPRDVLLAHHQKLLEQRALIDCYLRGIEEKLARNPKYRA